MDEVFSYLSWLENDQATKINDFVDNNKYRLIPKYEVDNFLKENYINYFDLPRYLKDKIDELDIV